MSNDSSDVIVIGAEVAGLAAARALSDVGLNVTILEAQARIGWRIYTARVSQVVDYIFYVIYALLAVRLLLAL